MQPPSIKYYEDLIFQTVHPRGNPKYPGGYHEWIKRGIIQEVRQENLRFYGREDERGVQTDALYPGHDYSSKSAKHRLGTYSHHRKLFHAFDKLNLTRAEIYALCNWEGTISARDRYEAETMETVNDLTWSSVPSPSPRRTPKVTHHSVYSSERTRLPKLNTKAHYDPIHPVKYDYYSNPQIWSSGGVPVSSRAQIAEDAFRETLAASSPTTCLSTPSPMRSTSSSAGNPQTPSTAPRTPQAPASWTRWISSAQQHGAHIPSGQDNSWLASHIPAHYAYATPPYHFGPHSPAAQTFDYGSRYEGTAPMSPLSRQARDSRNTSTQTSSSLAYTASGQLYQRSPQRTTSNTSQSRVSWSSAASDVFSPIARRNHRLQTNAAR